MNAIVLIDAGKLRSRRALAEVSYGFDEGFAKMQGRDANGRIKVWARHKVTSRFNQVGAMPNFEQAQLFVRQMLEDDSERRRALRDAKRMRFVP